MKKGRTNYYPHHLELQITQIYRSFLWIRFNHLEKNWQKPKFIPLTQKEKELAYRVLSKSFEQINKYSQRNIFSYFEKLTKEQQKSLVERFQFTELKARNDSLRMDATDPSYSFNDIFREGMNEDYINATIGNNVSLIDIAYKEHYDKIQTVIKEGLQEGLSTDKIAEKISAATGVSKSKADFWAQDQTSKFYGDVQRFNQTSAGYDGFIWRSVRDARVRLTHQELEGKFFLWTKGTGIPGREYPGRDYRCRCFAEPAFSDEWNISTEGRYKFAAERQRTTISLQTGHPLKNTIDKIVMDNILKNPIISQNLKLIKENAIRYGLTLEEAAIIYSYTTPDYYLIINRANRGEIEIDAFISEYTRALNSALDKLPNYKGEVYKGMDANFPDSELASIYKAFTFDQPYEVKGFYSTSKEYDIGKLKWKGNKTLKAFFTIKSKSGKYIQGLNWTNPENNIQLEEVLFKHPSKFKVKDFKLDNSSGIAYIFLEEI